MRASMALGHSGRGLKVLGYALLSAGALMLAGCGSSVSVSVQSSDVQQGLVQPFVHVWLQVTNTTNSSITVDDQSFKVETSSLASSGQPPLGEPDTMALNPNQYASIQVVFPWESGASLPSQLQWAVGGYDGSAGINP